MSSNPFSAAPPASTPATPAFSAAMGTNPWIASAVAARGGNDMAAMLAPKMPKLVTLAPANLGGGKYGRGKAKAKATGFKLDPAANIEAQLLANPGIMACVNAAKANRIAVNRIQIAQIVYDSQYGQQQGALQDLLTLAQGGKPTAGKLKQVADLKKLNEAILAEKFCTKQGGDQWLCAPPYGKLFANVTAGSSWSASNLDSAWKDGAPLLDHDKGAFTGKINEGSMTGDLAVFRYAAEYQLGWDWNKTKKLLYKVLKEKYLEYNGNLNDIATLTSQIATGPQFDTIYPTLENRGYYGRAQELKAWIKGVKTGSLIPFGSSGGAPQPAPDDPKNVVVKALHDLDTKKKALPKLQLANNKACRDSDLPAGIQLWAKQLGYAKAEAVTSMDKAAAGLKALKLVNFYADEMHALAKALYGSKCVEDLKNLKLDPKNANAQAQADAMTAVMVNCAKNPAAGSYLYSFQQAAESLHNAQLQAMLACGVSADAIDPPLKSFEELEAGAPADPMDPAAFAKVTGIANCKAFAQMAGLQAANKHYNKTKASAEHLVTLRQGARTSVVAARQGAGGTYKRADDAQKAAAKAKRLFGLPVQVGSTPDGTPIIATLTPDPVDISNIEQGEAGAEHIIAESNDLGAKVVAYGVGLHIAIVTHNLDNDPSESDATAEQACAKIKEQGGVCPPIPNYDGDPPKAAGSFPWAVVLALAAAAAQLA